MFCKLRSTDAINRQGVGFNGFIPVVVARLVNEAFGRRAAGIADMKVTKVTAPPELILNPKVRPEGGLGGIISITLYR
jgi:hypothetical protein